MNDPIPEISLAEAKALLDAGDTTFVDIRDPDSFRAAHVPGAMHLGNENLQGFLGSQDRSRPVVVYCYHGNSSLQGVAFLQDQGFETVHSMTGGFEAWRGNYPHE